MNHGQMNLRRTHWSAEVMESRKAGISVKHLHDVWQSIVRSIASRHKLHRSFAKAAGNDETNEHNYVNSQTKRTWALVHICLPFCGRGSTCNYPTQIQDTQNKTAPLVSCILVAILEERQRGATLRSNSVIILLQPDMFVHRQKWNS